MSKEISFKQILESEHYQQEKEKNFIEINKRQIPIKAQNSYYAPFCGIPTFNRTDSVNRKEFKHLDGERDLIKQFKSELPKTRNHKFETILKAIF